VRQYFSTFEILDVLLHKSVIKINPSFRKSIGQR